MPPEFIDALQRLHAFLPKAQPTPHELLDILWLAEKLRREPPVAAPQESARDEVREESPRGGETRETPSAVPRSATVDSTTTSGPAEPKAGETRVSRTSEADLVTIGDRGASRGRPTSAVPFKVPGVPGLPDTLRIGSALGPLMRRVPSRQPMVLDETATAERTADARFFEEVRRPASTRWLDLGLVVDRSGAMDFWDKSVAELRELVGRHRAFRNVRAWDMWDDGVELRFRTWSRERRDSKPSELSDPTGSQLLLVISDCVSRIWSDASIAQQFEEWSVHGPVAIVQVMPPELWRRTALRYARRTLVRAAGPVAPNRYVSDLSDASDGAGEGNVVLVPVASLEPAGIAEWAQFVAATGASARAYAFPTTLSEEERNARAGRAVQSRATGAPERVSRFDVTATPDARRLARLLAAAPYPLTPPVLRVIQDTVLPGTARSAVAEVILGGLMRGHPADSGDPELTTYRFLSEEIRNRLLERASATDMLRMMQVEVSKFVGQELGTVIDFSVLLKNPAAAGTLRMGADEIPLARIGMNALQRLGGLYADIAHDLEHAITTSQGDGDAEKYSTLRAYLEQDAAAADATSLERWVAGLRPFGIRLMLDAALIAAEQTRSGRRHTDLLEKTRACIRSGTREKATEVGALINADPAREPRERDAATRAAYAAVVAFGSLHRTGPQTEKAVKIAIAAAAAENNASALHAAIRKRFLADAMVGTLTTRDPLPFRGRVIVVGTIDREGLPPITVSTALQLGQHLARAGFELVAGAWPGVDFLVTSAFVREVELYGGDDVEARVTQRVEFGQTPDFEGLNRSEAVRSWADIVIENARAVVVIGPCSIETLERYAAQRHVPVLPLHWTNATSSHTGPRAGFFLNALDVNVELMIQRTIAALATLTDEQSRERWLEYTNIIYSLISEQRPPAALESKAPRFASFVRAVAADRSDAAPSPADAPFERLRELVQDLSDWLVFDLFALSDVEAEWFPERNFLLRSLAEVLHEVAPAPLLVWLQHRWREVGRLLPRRPVGGLLPIARVVFADPEKFSAWTHAIAGISPAECEFRMSIPFAVYDAAAKYRSDRSSDAERQLEAVLYGLQRRDIPYEFVSRYARAAEAGARLIAYVLMQMNVYSIAATELARRIDDEVGHAMDEHDARPLRQLLLATSSATADVDLSSRRIIARALASAATRLHGVEAYDRDRCLDLIQSILRMKPFEEAHTSNMLLDAAAESLRDSRRAVLPQYLRRAGFRGEELDYNFRNGTAEQRVLALRLAGITADASSFELVRMALSHPESHAELRTALTAAETMSARLTHAQLATLAGLVPGEEERSPEIAGLAAFVAEQLSKRFAAADRLRYAPIAIIGSDPSGSMETFCTQLGEALAQRELGVTVANPDLAAWLAEGYRAKEPNLLGFVMMRHATDRRPLRQGIPYRTIEGDLDLLREQMLGAVRGAIVIGGRKGTYEEYAMARRHGIPVVPVSQSGGAASGVARTAIERLADDELPRDLLRTLQHRDLSPMLATAIAEAMRWSVAAEESRRQEQLEEKHRAARMSDEELCRDVLHLRHGENHERRVGDALALLNMRRDGARFSGLKTSLFRARACEKRVERLAFAIRPTPAVTELIARCAFAMCVLETSALATEPAELAAVEEASRHDRFTAAGAEVLERLAQIIRGRGSKDSEARHAFLLARLQQELENLRRAEP